jgi:hypothetical protein
MIINHSSVPQSNNPVIGWDNHVTSGNVTASSEAVGYPAINVANPKLRHWCAGKRQRQLCKRSQSFPTRQA